MNEIRKKRSVISCLDVRNYNTIMQESRSCFLVISPYSFGIVVEKSPKAVYNPALKALCVAVFSVLSQLMFATASFRLWFSDLLQVIKVFPPSFAVRVPSQDLLGCIFGCCTQCVTYPNVHKANSVR